jgi:phosphoribosylamine--glycine ligase
VLPFASAQDHKRVYDGDKGPNTGGMGAYSPARLMDDNLEQVILNTIINPTAKAMAAEGMPFCGVFFAGLMVKNGQPKLLEYNTRFGDPECQTLMLRYEGDLAKLLYQCATKALTAEDVEKAKKDFSENPAICVVMAASGYPGLYVKNTVIKGLADNEAQGLKIFHAGTALSGGNVVSIGGRVLGVSAIAPSLLQARDIAYNAIAGIEWPEGFCRKDIGWRALG